MSVKGILVAEYGRTHSKLETVGFALKLLGLDEDVWRTTEEGKHFKLDNETGEIKAGFGGKLNGKTANAFKRGGKPKLTKEQTAKVESLKADFSNRSTDQIQRAYERLKESYNQERDWVEKYEQLPSGMKKSFAQQYQYHNSQAAPLKAQMEAFEDELARRERQMSFGGYEIKEQYTAAKEAATSDPDDKVEAIRADHEKRMNEARDRAVSRVLESNVTSMQDITSIMQDEVNRVNRETAEKLLEAEQNAEVPFDPEYEFPKLVGSHVPEAKQEKQIINPNGLGNNCYRCAVAEEMRFKGFDVQAKSGEDELFSSEDAIKSCFEGAELKPIDANSSDEYNQNVIAQMREWGDGARALCMVTGKQRSHVYNLYVRNGAVYGIDGQSGFAYSENGPTIVNGMKYIGIRPGTETVSLLRVDQTKPTAMMRHYCSGR